MTKERLKRLKEALDKIDHIMLYVSKKLSEAKKKKDKEAKEWLEKKALDNQNKSG